MPAPNVPPIMADELRADALGCYGNGLCHKPNLDRPAQGPLVERCKLDPVPQGKEPARLPVRNADRGPLSNFAGKLLGSRKGGADPPQQANGGSTAGPPGEPPGGAAMPVAAVLLLFAGVAACSTAVIFIKATATHPLWLAAARLLIATVILAPLWWLGRRQHPDAPVGRGTLMPGVLLAVHFISWIYAARQTPAANATLIVNLAPLASPVLLYLLLQERITVCEAVGTGLALLGVVTLLQADFSVSREHFFGDLLCFGSMLLFCLYLIQARRQRRTPTLWLYLVPVYLVAGLVCLLVALLAQAPLPPFSAAEVLCILGLGVVPTVIGHSLLNRSMRHLRGQVVTTANLGQVVSASIMAWLFFAEVPAPAVYVAAALIVAGILVTVLQPTAAPTTSPAKDGG